MGRFERTHFGLHLFCQSKTGNAGGGGAWKASLRDVGEARCRTKKNVLLLLEHQTKKGLRKRKCTEEGARRKYAKRKKIIEKERKKITRRTCLFVCGWMLHVPFFFPFQSPSRFLFS